MAVGFRCSNAAAIAALDALLDTIDTGGAGKLKIYTGAAPTNVEDAATGTLLATLTYSNPAFAGATDAAPGATASASAITSAAASNSGTAGYFRTTKNDGTTGVLQGTCGTSSADMIMNTTTVTSGLTVSCSSHVVVMPET